MALVSNRVGAFSAHFDRTRLFYTTKKSRKKYRNSALAAIISSMLMWIQTLKLRWHYGESNAQVYESYGFSYTGVIWTGILSLLYIEHDNVIGGVNRFLYYFQCFKQKWIPKVHDANLALYSKMLDMLILLTVSTCILFPLTITFYFTFFPNSAIYPGNIVPGGHLMKDNLLFKLICVSYCTWLACMTWYSIMSFVVMGTIYIASIFLVIREFKIDSSVHYALHALRTPNYLMDEYTTLHLLHQDLMKTFGQVFIFGHFVCSNMCIFCIYAVMRHWHDINTSTMILLSLWSVMIQIIWGMVLEVIGRFHLYLIKTMRSWKRVQFTNNTEAKLFFKCKRSKKPLIIGKDRVLTIKRLTVLKFFRQIIKATFRALLTVGQSN
ncbi:hypothetical protein Fcan01_01380 [Folsomia candida]|uniref:Gustatory receptor n=1 Tax=Folsomia candida TaxID=158441 RepID=A0A226EUQ6_FOLCA|nr:hypothetical protein Fcan01_01380 [Folsomia candida]